MIETPKDNTRENVFLHYRLDMLKPGYLGNIQSHIKLHLIPNHLFDMSKTSCQFERLMCSLVFPYRIKSWNTCSRLWGSFNENLQRQMAVRKHRANENHITTAIESRSSSILWSARVKIPEETNTCYFRFHSFRDLLIDTTAPWSGDVPL